MYILQLVFDPSPSSPNSTPPTPTPNSQNGRFESNVTGANRSPTPLTVSKAWFQFQLPKTTTLDPTSPNFNPRTAGISPTYLGTGDDNLGLSPQQTASQAYGTLIGVYFVVLNLPTATVNLNATVVFGRSQKGDQKWASPFTLPTATNFVNNIQSVFPSPVIWSLGPLASGSPPYVQGSQGFYFPLGQAVKTPPASIIHHYPFLVVLVATDPSSNVVAQWSHDPELDVSM